VKTFRGRHYKLWEQPPRGGKEEYVGAESGRTGGGLDYVVCLQVGSILQEKKMVKVAAYRIANDGQLIKNDLRVREGKTVKKPGKREWDAVKKWVLRVGGTGG